MFEKLNPQPVGRNNFDTANKVTKDANIKTFDDFLLTPSSGFLGQVKDPVHKLVTEQLSNLSNNGVFQPVSVQGIAGSEGVLGSKGPEGPYQSETHAALNGINRIGAIPDSKVNEYGGAVFEHSDGSFSISPIRTDGSPTAVIIDDLTVQTPEDANMVAIFHNHPRDSTLPANEIDRAAYEFSDTGLNQGDIPTAENMEVNLYIRIYDGAVRKYDFSDNSSQWIRHSPNSRNISTVGSSQNSGSDTL